MFVQRLRRERTAGLVAALLGAAALLAAVFAVPTTNSALTGKITNNANVASSNGYYTCQAAASGGSAAPFFTYPFNETSGAAGATDTSGNAHSGVYSTTGITYGASGPCPRDFGKAITLDGSSGQVFVNYSATAPTTLSEEIWFRTTTGGGKLFGYGNSENGTSNAYDRHIYMTNYVNVFFVIYTSGTTYNTVASPGTYNDGTWHDVIATWGAAGDTYPGMRLYVDGVLVGSKTAVTASAGINGAGYWRIGYDNLNKWPSAPSDYYFTGSLAFASAYLYTLSPTEVAAHYRAGL